jgi:phage gp29-like protein
MGIGHRGHHSPLTIPSPGGPEKSLPRFRFHYEAGEDLEKAARTYRELAEMGLTIGENHVREKFGIPAPEKNEGVIAPRRSSSSPETTTRW